MNILYPQRSSAWSLKKGPLLLLPTEVFFLALEKIVIDSELKINEKRCRKIKWTKFQKNIFEIVKICPTPEIWQHLGEHFQNEKKLVFAMFDNFFVICMKTHDKKCLNFSEKNSVFEIWIFENENLTKFYPNLAKIEWKFTKWKKLVFAQIDNFLEIYMGKKNEENDIWIFEGGNFAKMCPNLANIEWKFGENWVKIGWIFLKAIKVVYCNIL